MATSEPVADQWLHCPVCSQAYDWTHLPKRLECLHTLCLPCSESVHSDKQIVCPTCHCVSDIVSIIPCEELLAVTECWREAKSIMESSREAKSIMESSSEDVSDDDKHAAAVEEKKVDPVTVPVENKERLEYEKEIDAEESEVPEILEIMESLKKFDVNRIFDKPPEKQVMYDFQCTCRLEEFPYILRNKREEET